jgi:GNAT superfamily N-acetyltransferase
MTIQKYEEWMRPQIVALFNMEYGTAQGEFDQLFVNFYEHNFQREKCIRIVALDGEKVAGFQSFFYWPLASGGTVLNSYQSGNSLVHPDYRGKGLFAKMLNYIHEEGSGFSFDVLIGFPVQASYNSFIKNKWKNPFDLQWYVKPMNPVLSVISNPENSLLKKWGERKPSLLNTDPAYVCVAQTENYDAYRFAYQKGNYYRFEYVEGDKKALFELKAQRRKKIIKEIIIGKFLTTHFETAFIQSAFSKLEKEIKKQAWFSIITIAVNPLNMQLVKCLERSKYKKIDKKIYFIAKGPVADKVTNWSNWNMYRADIDTW